MTVYKKKENDMSDKKTRRFTIDEIRRLLKEHETMVTFKKSSLPPGSTSTMPELDGTDPEEFFSWVDGLTDDNVKSILEEK